MSVNVEHETKQDYVDAYVNNVTISIGPYDFSITFALTDPAEADSIPPKKVATIRMSPQHAKSVQILLARFVEVFEENVGEISLPEGLVQHLKGVAENERIPVKDDESTN